MCVFEDSDTCSLPAELKLECISMWGGVRKSVLEVILELGDYFFYGIARGTEQGKNKKIPKYANRPWLRHL